MKRGDVAVVTGGGRGIGRAVAHALAKEGAAVAVVARTQREIEAVAAEVEQAGGRAKPFACDVSDEAGVREMARAVEAALGPVSILVNNAGIAESAPFLKMDLEFYRRIMRVNVESAVVVTQAFLGGMVERNYGRVINIASVAGKLGAPYITAYVASKHAMVGLTRALALEYATKGITVNAVCPGYVDTPMTEGNIGKMHAKTGRSEGDIRATLEKMSPQGRIYTPEEVAAVVLALASDGFRGVNGQAISIDGGSST
jgi:NAD(P)-dependent dehydrogenase (short-subunit alcohol dehydrogenase family)